MTICEICKLEFTLKKQRAEFRCVKCRQKKIGIIRLNRLKIRLKCSVIGCGIMSSGFVNTKSYCNDHYEQKKFKKNRMVYYLLKGGGIKNVS